MSDIHQKLLAAFGAEHKEHISRIREMLLAHRDAGWPEGAFDFTEAHRRVHSLKGAARAVDFQPIETLAHDLETLFARMQSDVQPLNEQTSTVIRKAFDAIEDYVVAVRGGKPARIPDAVTAGVQGLIQGNSTPAPLVPETSQPESQRASSQPETPETVRVEVTSLDDLLKDMAELMQETRRQQQFGWRLAQLSGQVQRLVRQVVMARARGATAKRNADTVNVPVNSESTENAIRDGVENLAREMQSLLREHRAASWGFARVTKRLQDDIGRARLISANAVFDGLAAYIRDLATAEGKQAEVEVRGLEMLADRVVLQELRDPVNHIVRNAVTHGIESPAERRRAGKSDTATISMILRAAGDRLQLVIEDDGRGINREQLAKAGIAAGILSPDAATDLAADDIRRLLTHPGLSTAGSLTKLAGRGMGMSIVQTAVNRLGGELFIEPREQGTRIRISAPLSVSSTRVVLVRADSACYAIPGHSVEHLYRLKLPELSSMGGMPAILLPDMETPVPVAHLAQLTGDSVTWSRDTQAWHDILMLESNGEQLGVVVDRIEDVFDVLIRPMDAAAAADPLIDGAVTLDDGSVAMCLNVVQLIRTRASRGSTTAQASVETPAPVKPPLVLVVDDSVTTRTLERSILEANGYEVRVSVDGNEALKVLRREPVDLVICDIEMPNLDGFGVLDAMRQDQGLNQIPIIMVTSRCSDTDRRRALDLGAAAYVAKQKFDQKELIETIRRLL